LRLCLHISALQQGALKPGDQDKQKYILLENVLACLQRAQKLVKKQTDRSRFVRFLLAKGTAAEFADIAVQISQVIGDLHFYVSVDSLSSAGANPKSSSEAAVKKEMEQADGIVSPIIILCLTRMIRTGFSRVDYLVEIDHI